MVNYACAFSQSELGKYFEWIIKTVSAELKILPDVFVYFLCLWLFLRNWLFYLCKAVKFSAIFLNSAQREQLSFRSAVLGEFNRE